MRPRTLGIIAVRGYQLTLGRLFGMNCRFHPSCSEYAIEALSLNGLLVGAFQAIWRVMRCGPWTRGGVDYPRSLRLRRDRMLRTEISTGEGRRG